MWIVLSFNNKCLSARHACNPSSWEAKAERSWIKGQLGLYRLRFPVAFSETLLQPNTDFKNGKRKKKAKGLRALFMEEHLESWTPEGAGRTLWKSGHPGFWTKARVLLLNVTAAMKLPKTRVFLFFLIIRKNIPALGMQNMQHIL